MCVIAVARWFKFIQAPVVAYDPIPHLFDRPTEQARHTSPQLPSHAYGEFKTPDSMDPNPTLTLAAPFDGSYQLPVRPDYQSHLHE